MDDGRLKSKKRPTSSVQHGEMSFPTHRLPHGAGFPGSGLRAGCPGLRVPLPGFAGPAERRRGCGTCVGDSGHPAASSPVTTMVSALCPSE